MRPVACQLPPNDLGSCRRPSRGESVHAVPIRTPLLKVRRCPPHLRLTPSPRRPRATWRGPLRREAVGKLGQLCSQSPDLPRPCCGRCGGRIRLTSRCQSCLCGQRRCSLCWFGGRSFRGGLDEFDSVLWEQVSRRSWRSSASSDSSGLMATWCRHASCRCGVRVPTKLRVSSLRHSP